MVSLQRLLEISRLGAARIELVNLFRGQISSVGNQEPGSNDEEDAETGPNETGPNA